MAGWHYVIARKLKNLIILELLSVLGLSSLNFFPTASPLFLFCSNWLSYLDFSISIVRIKRWSSSIRKSSVTFDTTIANFQIALFFIFCKQTSLPPKIFISQFISNYIFFHQSYKIYSPTSISYFHFLSISLHIFSIDDHRLFKTFEYHSQTNK